jgi:hypothetical protein
MRSVIRLLGILGLAAAAWTAAGAAEAGTPALAVPAGAMVYAEASDLNGLLAQWEASTARKTWESGAARELFSRSRVFLKWDGRLEKLSELAGRPLDLKFLRQLEARRAVLAVYDPGRREGLLALETGPAGRAVVDAVAAALDARDLDGTAYRGRFLEEEGIFLGVWREGAMVYLATSDRLLREVIRLRREGGGWAFPEAAAARPYALRLDMNLAAIRQTSYYHRYWIHGAGGEWTDCARALLVITRAGAGWTEERLFLRDAAGPAEFPAVAAPDPGIATPFWWVRRAAAAADVRAILLQGVLRLPDARQAELKPQRQFQGAAFRVAAAETSDFDKTIDTPAAEVSAEALWAGAAGPGDELDAFLARSAAWPAGWCWDLPRAGDARAWSAQGGALALAGERTAGTGGKFREILSRLLAAAYLTSPAVVSWTEVEPGVFRLRDPLELWMTEDGSGALVLATSSSLLTEARRLTSAGVSADAAAGMNLAAAGDKYRRLLADMGQEPSGRSAAGAPGFMSQVVPSVLGMLQAVDRIRFVQSRQPAGIYERVDYLAAP